MVKMTLADVFTGIHGAMFITDPNAWELMDKFKDVHPVKTHDPLLATIWLEYGDSDDFQVRREAILKSTSSRISVSEDPKITAITDVLMKEFPNTDLIVASVIAKEINDWDEIKTLKSESQFFDFISENRKKIVKVMLKILRGPEFWSLYQEKDDVNF